MNTGDDYIPGHAFPHTNPTFKQLVCRVTWDRNVFLINRKGHLMFRYNSALTKDCELRSLIVSLIALYVGM